MTNEANTTAERDYPELPDLDADPRLWNLIYEHRTATPGAVSFKAAKKIDDLVHSYIRAGIDADRASRAQAAQAVSEGVVDALRPFAEIGSWLFARPQVPDDTIMVEVDYLNGVRTGLTRGQFKAAHEAMLAAAPSAPAPEAALQELVNISQELGLYEDMASAPSAPEAPTPSEWDVRGHLAAALTCWHRLTEQEAAELVALFKGRPAPAPDDSKQRWMKLADERAIEVAELKTQLARMRAAPAAVPVELAGIEDAIKEGGGFWRSCSGCHELNEGHATGPYSKVFKCALGSGCDECGGIGAIWDTTDYGAIADAMAESATQAGAAHPAEGVPIDMVLHCPKCGMQHIDAPEREHIIGVKPYAEKTPANTVETWTNPPHRSHLCHGCGHIWRPADVPTNGVQAVKTAGKADSPVVAAVQHKGDVEGALSCVKDLIEVARMPNAEYVADAHNAAVRRLRAIAQAKESRS